MVPNPNFTSWLERARLDGLGKKALQIACGLGDDAEDLAAAGFQVTAFDIAPTAIQWCTTRFPESSVTYQVADLFRPPPTWLRGFDFVLEVYTLQSLPRELRSDAMAHMAACVAPGGDLLVIGRLTDDGADTDSLPWPLMRQELSVFADAGLREIRVEDYVDDEDPPVRRVRAHFRRGT
jgi:ubiquinone/menaquinone biosynthesis C-methylase UbiE